MLIKNTKALAQGPLKIFVYGESGSGKTTLARTLPGAPNEIFIISAESGLLSIRDSGIDYVDISRNDKDEVIAKEHRLDRLGEVYKFLQSDEAKAKYKWIVLDSLTEIGQCLIDKLKLEYTDPKSTIKMYGENAYKMRSIVKLFRDLPAYSVMMTALSEKDKDETGRIYQAINLIGRISQEIPQFFDEVFYLAVVEEGRRVLVCDKTDKVFAKDRSGKLDRVEPADLSQVVGKIRKEQAPVTQASEKPAPSAGSASAQAKAAPAQTVQQKEKPNDLA